MKQPLIILLLALLLTACVTNPNPPPSATTLPTATNAPAATASVTESPTDTPNVEPSNTPQPLVPNFDHIVIVVFENREFGSVIGNSEMPNFNKLANDYTLLTQYYAVTHPSLPNYIALIGGDTFGIDKDCHKCFISARNIADLIEESGRTWKAYQEDMPEPCYLGDTDSYFQNHDPFLYFDNIRLDSTRCEKSVVPLADLQADLEAGTLPNFMFITPNICNDAHDCDLNITDSWMTDLLGKLVPALDADGGNYAIFLTFDEGQGNHSCCGLPTEAGGRVATVIYSPLVKNGFDDRTPYTHYSLLKTISEAWGMPYLGHAADDGNVLITLPWK
jgi:phospholipase C